MDYLWYVSNLAGRYMSNFAGEVRRQFPEIWGYAYGDERYAPSTFEGWHLSRYWGPAFAYGMHAGDFTDEARLRDPIFSRERLWHVLRNLRRHGQEPTGTLGEHAIYDGLNYGLNRQGAGLRYARHMIPYKGYALEELEITQLSDPSRPVTEPLLILPDYREEKVSQSEYAQSQALGTGQPVLIANWPGQGDSIWGKGPELDTYHGHRRSLLLENPQWPLFFSLNDPRQRSISGLSAYGHSIRLYTQALEAFLGFTDKIYAGKPLNILAHGMGAAVLLNAALDGSLRDHAHRFNRVAMVAPMLALGGWSGLLQGLDESPLANLVSKAFLAYSRGKSIYRVPGQRTPDAWQGYDQFKTALLKGLGILALPDTCESDWFPLARQMMDLVERASPRDFEEGGLEPSKVVTFTSRTDPVINFNKTSRILRRKLPRARHITIPLAPHAMHRSSAYGNIVNRELVGMDLPQPALLSLGGWGR